ncbi:hypothetical protein BDW71DRAFT_193170 [Aspergillus fruticulosus]
MIQFGPILHSSIWRNSSDSDSDAEHSELYPLSAQLSSTLYIYGHLHPSIYPVLFLIASESGYLYFWSIACMALISCIYNFVLSFRHFTLSLPNKQFTLNEH